MNTILHLPNHNTLLYNFHNCINWEEKYLYIIELGNYLSNMPKKKELKKCRVPGCQSMVWIAIQIEEKNIVNLYGDSDSSIIRGILCIIFIIYKGLSLNEFIRFNPYLILNKLELNEHLTHHRSQGIKSILYIIHNQAKKLKTQTGLNEQISANTIKK